MVATLAEASANDDVGAVLFAGRSDDFLRRQ